MYTIRLKMLKLRLEFQRRGTKTKQKTKKGGILICSMSCSLQTNIFLSQDCAEGSERGLMVKNKNKKCYTWRIEIQDPSPAKSSF